MNFQEIAEYCHSYIHERPFSHIVMDLYNEVILRRASKRHSKILPTAKQTNQQRKTDTDASRCVIQQARPSFTSSSYYHNILNIFRSDEDIDSGHSSSPGDFIARQSNGLTAGISITNHVSKEPLKLPPSPPLYATSLKVLRRNHNNNETNNNSNTLRRTPPVVQQMLQIRRRRDGALTSTTTPHDDRRNTIAVITHASEWQSALAAGAMMKTPTNLPQCSTSRSTDNLRQWNDGNAKHYDCVGDNAAATTADDVAPTSLNISTLPRLRVRRMRPVSTIGTMSSTHCIKSPRAAATTANKSNAKLRASPSASGPEFIYNSSQPPRELDIAGPKCNVEQRRTVSVLLLNGRTLRIGCHALRTQARDIYETVLRTEAIAENFFLGLCALIGGDFVFLPDMVRVYKVAPQIWRAPNIGDSVIFTLFLRVRFFLPDLRGIGYVGSKYYEFGIVLGNFKVI